MQNVLPELRRQKGWSQQRLADQVGVSRQTIISIERGRFDPSLPLAFRLARVFDRAIEEIFTSPETDD
ncbi:helix-turn-helix transcriptional regulator [Propioniciclava flava]|uniref:Transcriptional regulator n=1 Tax=Propioniciclava flava TaxID=2072026 RepID=A0A4Q2EG19_9ACTN|nr:helix-turn-helix transcriptional regulator [Propioniciclava flava]RXW32507.1 transcriptional regulator [Propioniciclava flava]